MSVFDSEDERVRVASTQEAIATLVKMTKALEAGAVEPVSKLEPSERVRQVIADYRFALSQLQKEGVLTNIEGRSLVPQIALDLIREVWAGR